MVYQHLSKLYLLTNKKLCSSICQSHASCDQTNQVDIASHVCHESTVLFIRQFITPKVDATCCRYCFCKKEWLAYIVRCSGTAMSSHIYH